MRYYRDYMDRQRVSDTLHGRLLELERPAKRSARWARWGALAACCALLAGVGVWRLAPGPAAAPPASSAGLHLPGPGPEGSGTETGDRSSTAPNYEEDPVQPAQPALNEYNFLADCEKEGRINSAMIPGVAYPVLSRGAEPSVAPDYALPVGSFSVGLTRGEISRMLGQEEGQANVPWLLGWDGYTISGRADYDPEGKLTEVTVWGVREEDFFTLRLSPGGMPPACTVRTDGAVTDVRGVEVTAWQTAYDADGDGEIETLYETAFMSHDVGVRFTVQVDNPGAVEAGAWRSNLLVNWCSYADCPLTLEHLLVNGNIPAWRREEYNTYAPLRLEAEFVPYLPGEEPAGFGEFEGYLTYQEGKCNTVHATWLREYDYVCLAVFLPEGEREEVETADISRPETYDVRLYSVPWCDSVPEELMHYFLSPAVFRAEDMSLEVVEARMTPHDTGGEHCTFKVLHENGVLVSYDIAGLSARAVWEIVEETLAD